MPLHIRDETTTQLVRSLAQRRRIGLTEAVKIAVQNELRREEEAVPLRDRIAAIRHGIVARPLTGEHADKAFFDELGGDL
jgi:antitoxin VapB